MTDTELIIYYFSGTGNTAKAAADLLNQSYLSGRIISITESGLKIKTEPNSLLGFCFPTHGFNAPPIMLKHLWNFPKGKNKVFLLNTRAGMKMYKIFTPGLGGLALWLPAVILKIKGYRVCGYMPLDMPSNWISFHPGLKEKVSKSIVSRCEKITNKYANHLSNGESIYSGFLYLPLDFLVAPIAILYYLFGRFALAKTFYASNNCNNCGLCLNHCPLKAIKEVDKRPFWTLKCESCSKCINTCPKRAIETAHGYTALLWYLVFSLIPIGIIRLMVTFETAHQIVLENLKLVEYLYIILLGILFICMGYYLMHYLLRFRFFRWMLRVTSLTSYGFWRRYKLLL